MPTQDNIKEIVWRQLIDLIDSTDMFFPEKIRKKIQEETQHFLDDFIKTMKDNDMLVEFKKKSLANRIAHWFFRAKIKKEKNKNTLLEIYVKGSDWEKLKPLTYAQVAGKDSTEDSETTLH